MLCQVTCVFAFETKQDLFNTRLLKDSIMSIVTVVFLVTGCGVQILSMAFNKCRGRIKWDSVLFLDPPFQNTETRPEGSSWVALSGLFGV